MGSIWESNNETVSAFMKRRLFNSLLLLLGWAVFSRFAWKTLPIPLVFVCFSFALVCLYLAIKSASPDLRSIWIYSLAISTAIGLAEIWFQEPIQALVQTHHKKKYPDTIHDLKDLGPAKASRTFDPNLGFVLPKNVQVQDTATILGRRIYDVKISFGPEGLRTVPERPERGTKACVLFFGCSFVFGWGLNDDETLPAYTSRLLGSGYQVTNFGATAYGPHQALAMLESGMAEKVTDCSGKPVFAILVGMPHHVIRASGAWEGNLFGPRYELRGGRLERRGNFWSPFSRSEAGRGFVLGLVWKSALVRALLNHESAADQDRHVAILEHIFAEMGQRFPGSKSTLLYWDLAEPIANQLGRHRVPYIDVDSILPPAPGTNPWRISDYDYHPNAKANQRLAEYVVRNIVGQPLPSSALKERKKPALKRGRVASGRQR